MKKVACFIMFLFVAGCADAGKKTSSIDPNSEFSPAKNVQFIVGFDAGGTADIPARIMTKYMSELAGVNVTVANLVGSAGLVAANRVLESDPDGLTLLHVPMGYYLQNALGNTKLSYKDFTPVTIWADSWVTLVTKAGSDIKSYDDLIAKAKANPGSIKIGVVSGTLPQLAALEIANKEGVEFNMIDLGSNNKVTELLAGRVDGYIDGYGIVKPFVESGEFEIQLVFAGENADIPNLDKNIPTSFQKGYGEVNHLYQPFGLWLPPGTPDNVTQYYVNLVKEVSENPDFQREVNALGFGARYEQTEDYIEIADSTLNLTKQAISQILGTP